MTIITPGLRLMIDVADPSGTHNRWGLDEPNPANVPGNLSFSSTMPGGFEQMGCTLTRHPDIDYSDLTEFSTITVYGAGGQIAWQGRLQASPRVSGDQLSISPAAIGWQAALDDDKSARMIYIDIDLTRWQDMTVKRQAALIGASFELQSLTGVQTDPDLTTGQPCLVTALNNAWSAQAITEGWYDAHGIAIGSIGYAWKKSASVDPANASWSWVILLSQTDNQVGGQYETTANLRAAGPGSGWLNPAGPRYWATTELVFGTAAGTAGIQNSIYWTNLTVLGAHGLTLRGSLGLTAGACGLYASDVVQHAVNTWAPELATSQAGQSTIEATTFIIPQLAFLDPTTASTIIQTALQYQVRDWWVDEGPTFHEAQPQNHGRDWRAMVGPSGLQETGPQVDRLVNRVIVPYTDVTGITRTVGPIGSNANTIDDSLADHDPSNPVNAAGIIRYPANFPSIGVSTPAGAVAVGQAFLYYNQQLSTAGQATIVGTVQDSAGVTWPAWKIRAGDRITFTDAHDPVPRRIVRAQYSDDTKTCQIDLDSPPSGLDALLARFAGAVKPLGF